MTVTLHHLGRSRSERIIWLMEELGASYQLVRHERDPQTRLAPPALAAVHPLGKAPVLVEEDGTVIAETGAIAQRLLARFDPDHALHPAPDDPDCARFLEWMHAAEGAVFLPFLMNTYLSATGLSDSRLAAYMEGERSKALAHIEAHLAAHDWFAGARFTAADCLMGFQLDAAGAAGAIGADSPVQDWLARIHARPAYQSMRAVTAED